MKYVIFPEYQKTIKFEIIFNIILHFCLYLYNSDIYLYKSFIKSLNEINLFFRMVRKELTLNMQSSLINRVIYCVTSGTEVCSS